MAVAPKKMIGEVPILIHTEILERGLQPPFENNFSLILISFRLYHRCLRIPVIRHKYQVIQKSEVVCGSENGRGLYGRGESGWKVLG